MEKQTPSKVADTDVANTRSEGQERSVGDSFASLCRHQQSTACVYDTVKENSRIAAAADAAADVRLTLPHCPVCMSFMCNPLLCNSTWAWASRRACLTRLLLSLIFLPLLLLLLLLQQQNSREGPDDKYTHKFPSRPSLVQRGARV